MGPEGRARLSAGGAKDRGEELDALTPSSRPLKRLAAHATSAEEVPDTRRMVSVCGDYFGKLYVQAM